MQETLLSTLQATADLDVVAQLLASTKAQNPDLLLQLGVSLDTTAANFERELTQRRDFYRLQVQVAKNAIMSADANAITYKDALGQLQTEFAPVCSEEFKCRMTALAYEQLLHLYSVAA